MATKLVKAIDDAAKAMRFNALHNTTAEGIRASDKLGGIPAPSHALVREGQEFDSFGDISLVAPEELVDPGRGNKLFGADVFSRRQPKPLFRTSKKISSPEAQAVRAAMDEFKDSSRFEFSDQLGDGDPGQFRNSPGLLAAYARANGIDVPSPAVSLTDSEINVLGRDLRASRSEMKGAMDKAIEGIDDPDEMAKRLRKVEDEFLPGMKSIENQLDAGKPASAQDIRDLIEGQGLDPRAAEKWLIDGLIDSGDWSRPFFERGRKKVDYTADNLADFMNARTRGEEQTLVEGLGKQRARSAKQFKTIDQARNRADTIVGDAEMAEFRDYSNQKLFNLADSVTSEFPSQFQKLDDLSGAVGDVMKGASPQQALRQRDLKGNIDDELIAFAEEIRGGPTEYFESKFQGVAQLDQYNGAVVPEGTDPDVIKTLQDKGLQVETYTDPASRAKARAKIPGSSFAVPIGGGLGVAAAISPEDAEAGALGTASRLGRAADQGFDTGKVLFHGTADDISNFRVGEGHDAGWLGRGTYLTDSPGIASSYSNLKAGRGDPNVMPLVVKEGLNFKTVGPEFKERIMLIENSQGRQAAEEAAQDLTDQLSSEGFDGVSVSFGDSGGTEFVVFDPANIRSVNAQFDPAKTGSSNLLAGTTGAGTIAAVDQFNLAPDLPSETELLQQDSPVEQFRKTRAAKKDGFQQFKDTLLGVGETAATIGSAIGGGIVGDLSRLGGFINPFSTVEETEAGAQALQDKLQFIPSENAVGLDAIGAAAAQAEKEINQMKRLLKPEDSIPGQIFEALPERVQGITRVLGENLL